MTTLVSGAAGFIGSHLVEALLAEGHSVRAVDCYTPYYDRRVKEANLADALTGHAGVEVVEADLRTADVVELLDGIDTVFHLAGQPGVRLSWAEGFTDYDSHNILATQRLLEACRGAGARVPRLVFASSSSIYGNAERYPTLETDVPRPRSPYGVTKLAAEFLCRTYADNWGVPAIMLRYFTVYGPRQRPDMAFHRLLTAGTSGGSFPMYGDGSQIREFTYVGDVVRANLAAATVDIAPGEVFNVSGGSAVSLSDAVRVAEDLLGCAVKLDHQPDAPGDARRTGGSIDKARTVLGWAPATDLRTGMAAQLDWLRSQS